MSTLRRTALTRGGRYDQNLITYINLIFILFHGNNDIVIFALNKVFLITTFLIAYDFQNSCHQCQYHIKLYSLNERRRKKNLKLNEDK